MQFLEYPDWLSDVLDHVLHQDLIERRVLDRVGKLVEIVDDVGGGVSGDIEPDRPRKLGGAAADIEDRSRPARGQIELVRIGQAPNEVGEGSHCSYSSV